MATYKERQRLTRQLHTQYLGFIREVRCCVDLNVTSVIGPFDVTSEMLRTECFGLEGLHQQYTPQTVQKPM